MLFPDQLRSSRLLDLGGKGNLTPGQLESMLALARRPLDRAFERRATALSDLAALGKDVAKAVAVGRDGRSRGPRVLVVSLRGWSVHNAYELAIAHALRLRGAEVALLTCGGGMPACELGWARRAHPRPCDRCAWLTDRVVGTAGLEHRRLGQRLPWGSDSRAAPIGTADSGAATDARNREASRVSSCWLLKTTRPELVRDGEHLVADFATAAAGVETAAADVLDELRPEIVFMFNGTFAAERVIRGVAIERGIRAPTYEMAQRAGALVLSQDFPACECRLDGLWQRVRKHPLSERQRQETVGLLRNRAEGVDTHESSYSRMRYDNDPAQLRRQLGLDERKRLVSLYPNVIWDSAAVGHDVAFASIFDWIEQAVRLAGEGELARELDLVIRTHPAEQRWGTRESVQETLASRVGELPPNVRLIRAEEPLSSYTLMETSDLVLTYTTTVGLEAAARGKRVVVAGDTHYRGRGFTYDLDRREQLSGVLARPPSPPSSEETELALRYAHMFFFRMMIPFPGLQTHGDRVIRAPRRAAELQPGTDPYLDWICARILDGDEFGLPDELARDAQADSLPPTSPSPAVTNGGDLACAS
ncbi:MAG TPA: hypothetical protein VHU13_07290 [Solirubrobacteraceae bacterium]|nr:hypothetical protein [Solirubrobacteraceae bacterium]